MLYPYFYTIELKLKGYSIKASLYIRRFLWIMSILAGLCILTAIIYRQYLPGLIYRWTIASYASSSNQHISFYGVVIDQKSKKPIDDAVIEYEVGKITEKMLLLEDDQNNKKAKIITTKSGGRFTIKEYGAVLQIKKISKFNYLERNGSLYNYLKNSGNKFTPNYDSPEVFSLWKPGQREPLIKEERVPILSATPSIGIFNKIALPKIDQLLLKENKQSNFFELAVWPRGYDSSLINKWKYTIRIKNGRLQPAKDYYTYLAPENGYASDYTIEYNNQNTQIEKQEYYFYLGNQEYYGVITVRIYPDHRKMYANCSYSINPKIGSRNLEPGKDIQSP